jgi:hypothetical protein
MARRITIEGVSAAHANLRAFDKLAMQRVRGAQRVNGRALQAATRNEAPKDTGFMASQTRVDFSEQGYAYDVGYDAGDFTSAGKVPYFAYAIFGTSQTPPNDFPLRAFEQERIPAQQRIADALKGAADSVLEK